MKITSHALWITFWQLWVRNLAISCSFFLLSNVWLLCSSNFNQDDTEWFDLTLFCARKVTCSSSFNWEDDTEWLRWRRQHRRQINSSIRVRSDLFMREYAYELWSILWELIVGFQELSIAMSSLAILGFVVQPM